MNKNPADLVLRQLVQWAEGEPAIRALLLVSGRATRDASLEMLSVSLEKNAAGTLYYTFPL